MRALMNRTGQGGQAGGGIGMDSPGAGEEYAKQVSDLKGADPGQMMAQIKRLKQICAVLAIQNMERLPNVSGQMYKIIPMFDRVLKEIQQAQSVNAAVRNPISMGAATPQPGQEGGNATPGMF